MSPDPMHDVSLEKAANRNALTLVSGVAIAVVQSFYLDDAAHFPGREGRRHRRPVRGSFSRFLLSLKAITRSAEYLRGPESTTV